MEVGLGDKVSETFARASITNWLKKKVENYLYAPLGVLLSSSLLLQGL